MRRERITPFLLFLAVVILRVHDRLADLAMQLSGRSVSALKVFVPIIAGVLLVSALILARRASPVDLVVGARTDEYTVEVPERGTRCIGGIALEGRLELPEDPRLRERALLELHRKVAGVFEALRNAQLAFTYSISHEPSLLGGPRYSMLLILRAKSPEELRRVLEYARSACEATLPELRARILSSAELRRILGSMPLPHKLASGVRAPEDAFAALFMAGAEGASYNSTAIECKIPTSQQPEPTQEAVRLGKALIDGRPLFDVYVPLRCFASHAAIFGTTGSGKTTTAKTIALRLYERGVGVLVLDWHNEYTELALKLGGQVYSPGIGGIAINPLMHLGGCDLVEHIEFMTDLMSDIFGLTAPQAYTLQEALKRALIKAKVERREATLKDLLKEVERAPIRSGWDHETKMALVRRLKLLTEGRLGEAFCGERRLRIPELLSRRFVVIELGHFRDVTAKRLLASAILKMVYDYYVGRRETSELRHVIIIEEARNIIPRKAGALGPTERMLCELRKYGEGLIVVSQSPSAISSEALRNTSIKIIHALRDGDDIEVALRAMGLERRYAKLIHDLNVGEALVDIPGYGRPLVVRIDKHPLLDTDEGAEIVIEA